jgi:hypothetical protein
MNLKQLITGSLVDTGFLPEGEEASPEAVIDAIDRLNDILGILSNDSIVVPFITTTTFSTMPQLRSCTLGPTGTYVMPIPMEIESLIITDAESNKVKPAAASADDVDFYACDLSEVPSMYAFIEGATVARLEFNRIPPAGCSMVIRSIMPFTALAELTEDLSFPPGYNALLRSALTMVLCPKYGKQVPPGTSFVYQMSYNSVVHNNSVNRKPKSYKFDPAITERRRMWL